MSVENNKLNSIGGLVVRRSLGNAMFFEVTARANRTVMANPLVWAEARRFRGDHSMNFSSTPI
jgi:hypothetical protein